VAAKAETVAERNSVEGGGAGLALGPSLRPCAAAVCCETSGADSVSSGRDRAAHEADSCRSARELVHRDFTWTVHRPFIECCCTCPVSEVHGTRLRAAARDALATRTRALTAGILTVSAALSGVFAGIAAASAPGHKLSPGTSSPGTKTSTSRQTAAHSSLAIPPLPAAPGPGNLGSASPPAPTPAPAPSPTQSPPAVVSGSS
jgi:hypothetical protein